MKSLRWLGPILDLSGYASAGRGYLRAADAVGIRIQARDRSRSANLKNKGIDQRILDMYARLSKTEVEPDAPTVQHQVPDCFFRDSKTRLSIGYTIFEMTGVPPPWVGHCNEMAAIWTGSEYSRRAFMGSGVTVPVHVLRHALDMDAYRPGIEPWSISNRRSFAFLSVFDFTARKAWRELLSAYWGAFKAGDDVCLILKVYFGDFGEGARKDVMRRIASYKAELKLTETPPILLYGYDVPGDAMPSLYAAADCYVGISREGFGLPYAEAMACGLPCIGPEVGGTRAYMTPENSFLVKHVGDEPIAQEIVDMFPSFAGLRWAKHSPEHLSEVMRRVVYEGTVRKQVGERGTSEVRSSLSYEAIGRRIEELLPS